jgi:MoaA/NifB/PqqE/SkfB family radical SAM enzyme
MEIFSVDDNKENKRFYSENYNYDFNKITGFFKRWGHSENEDPFYSPFGPEILDIEISTKCAGVNGKLCAYCYKSNSPIGHNMSFKDFKIIIDKVNQNNQLTQIALGLGSTGEENPHIWDMCRWLREERGIIPNGTVAVITDETAEKIAKWFGACAISNHGDKDICYDSVKKLTDLEMKQVNIHQVIHSNNYDEILKMMQDMLHDAKLKKMNALVLLSLKRKGRASCNKFQQLDQEYFNNICKFSFENKLSIGFDSCSAHKVYNYINLNLEYDKFRQYIEPCEGGLFSAYINVKGEFYPCSFAEGHYDNFKNVIVCNNFIDDIWNEKVLNEYRDESLNLNRECLFYKI